MLMLIFTARLYSSGGSASRQYSVLTFLFEGKGLQSTLSVQYLGWILSSKVNMMSQVWTASAVMVINGSPDVISVLQS